MRGKNGMAALPETGGASVLGSPKFRSRARQPGLACKLAPPFLTPKRAKNGLEAFPTARRSDKAPVKSPLPARFPAEHPSAHEAFAVAPGVSSVSVALLDLCWNHLERRWLPCPPGRLYSGRFAGSSSEQDQ